MTRDRGSETVDEGLQVTPTTARWLAAATAVLLVLGVVSAGVVDAGGSGSDAGVVSAASNTTPTVDVPSSTTTTVASALPPVTPAPPSTVARSTTVPKAAAAVLAAIGTTAPPTTQPPAPATTRAPVPPTTATTATTTTTVSRRATFDFVNDHPNAVVVTVNKQQRFNLAPGARLDDVDVPLAASGKDIVEVVVVDTPCFMEKAGDLLQPGGNYLVRVSAGRNTCGTIPEPELDVRPAQAGGAPR